jgi:hypothetical protein
MANAHTCVQPGSTDEVALAEVIDICAADTSRKKGLLRLEERLGSES